MDLFSFTNSVRWDRFPDNLDQATFPDNSWLPGHGRPGAQTDKDRRGRIASSRCNHAHAPRGRLGPSDTGHWTVPDPATHQGSASRGRRSPSTLRRRGAALQHAGAALAHPPAYYYAFTAAAPQGARIVIAEPLERAGSPCRSFHRCGSSHPRPAAPCAHRAARSETGHRAPATRG